MKTKAKRIILAVIIIVGGGLIALVCSSAYIVEPKLFYCQKIAIDYLPLISDGFVLSRIEENKDKNGSEYISFTFDYESNNNVYEIEQGVYTTWLKMKEYLNKSSDLNGRCIDIVIRNNKYQLGAGIRNFDMDGKYLGNKWILYNAYLHNWQDTEKYNGLFGILGCNLKELDITSVTDETLAPQYIYVHCGDTEAEWKANDAKLRSVFPESDVDCEKYCRLHILYVLGW